MEAVIRDGGHQYTVAEGEVLDVEFRELGEGETLEFPEVLYIRGDGDARIGAPTVDGAKVIAKVVGPVKGDKLIVAVDPSRHTRYRENTLYIRAIEHPREGFVYLHNVRDLVSVDDSGTHLPSYIHRIDN